MFKFILFISLKELPESEARDCRSDECGKIIPVTVSRFKKIAASTFRNTPPLVTDPKNASAKNGKWKVV